MMPELSPAWQALLQSELQKPYFARLEQALTLAYQSQTIYPPREALFSAFELCEPRAVRVVILGQDPYHEPGQANGLAFSVSPGQKLPPSLQNIYKELEQDLGLPPAKSGDLRHWTEQGVFLLNSVLSVRAHEANSHKALGWQTFTDAVIAALRELPQPIAFLLWGAQAQKKAACAQSSPFPRLVLSSAHPSPLSAYRGFFGSRPFSAVNAFLVSHGEIPIDWKIPEDAQNQRLDG